MRLIDADALKESIRCSDTDEPKVLSPKKLHKVLTEWIDKRPTIEERKTGKWIWDDEGYHCSECFFHAYGNTLECLDGTYRFCPNCGADMRGREDE